MSAPHWTSNGFGKLTAPGGTQFEAVTGKNAEPLAQKMVRKLNSHDQLVKALNNAAELIGVWSHHLPKGARVSANRFQGELLALAAAEGKQ